MSVFTPPETVWGANVGDQFAAETTLIVKQCATCGITYAMPKRLDDSARKFNRTTNPHDHWSFCCPLGHTLSYPGLNREQQLAENLERERQRAGYLAAERDQLEASRNAHKGQATRARKERDRLTARAKAGVCPCCNRTFKQLARHMKAKHPDFEADPENAPARDKSPGA